MSMPRWSVGAVSGVILGLVGVPCGSAAQFDEPPPAAAYALTGVSLVQADGAVRHGLTIVVRNGLIEALGSEVSVPSDAEVLEGDSLMVYPGLIDAHGTADVAFPEPEIDRDEIETWNPSRAMQSFLPHRRVVDFLTATGSSLQDARTDGVVASVVLPEGPVMPGRGAVLVHRPAAQTPTALVVTPELGPLFSLDGARGVYPSTLFAVSAFIRQSFEDARHDGLVREAYRRDPHGLPLPSWDPDYEVLRSVAAGEQPVFFKVDEAEQIRLALSLADEYGFRPILVGAAEGWRVAELLRERRVPVLVSLDFPRPDRWDPEAAEDTTQAEPQDAAAAREQRDFEDRYANAARLVAAGVQVALTSGGEGGLREGVAKAMAYGLGEQQALAAVTATPASLFGLEPLLRIEAGMPATLVVTDGPLFGDDTAVRYTFVAGELARGRPARAAAASGEAPAVDMTGTWTVRINAEGQTMSGSMTLEQDGAEFSGTMTLDMGDVRIQSGTVSGTDISFVLRISAGGQTMEFDAQGTVEGDQANGRGSGAMGSFTWTARRSGTPDSEVRS